MNRPNYLEKITNRIETSGRGTMFITSDFLDIASTDVVNKALSRLEKSNVIRRIMRGIYEYHEYSELLEEYVAASPDRVAHALARNYGWNIAPCGDTALNLLGLSTQVPATWSYVSDGPYKDYKFDNVLLEFKHTANKEISKTSPKTALVIQAIKTLGQGAVDDTVVLKLVKLFDFKEKKIILKEAQNTTAWIFEIIKKVCERKELADE